MIDIDSSRRNNPFQLVEGRVLLIDGMALAYRAFYAIPPRTSPVTGEQTSVIGGFVSMLLSLMDRLQPEYVIVALEGGACQHRQALYPEYKATRPAMPVELKEQVDRLIYLLEKGLGIPCFRREGYEADDVLAALASLTAYSQPQNQSEGEMSLSVVISTGDKDMLQLIGDRVQVFMAAPKFADSKLYGRAEVLEKYGFAPEQLPLYLALLGDRVDNIPGVPGVGEQSARKLTIAYGDIEKLTRAAKDTLFGIQQKRLRQSILNNLEQIQRNLQLVKLAGMGTVEATKIIGFVPSFERFGNAADQVVLVKVFQELGLSDNSSGKLNGLLNRIYAYRQNRTKLS